MKLKEEAFEILETWTYEDYIHLLVKKRAKKVSTLEII